MEKKEKKDIKFRDLGNPMAGIDKKSLKKLAEYLDNPKQRKKIVSIFKNIYIKWSLFSFSIIIIIIILLFFSGLIDDIMSSNLVVITLSLIAWIVGFVILVLVYLKIKGKSQVGKRGIEKKEKLGRKREVSGEKEILRGKEKLNENKYFNLAKPQK